MEYTNTPMLSKEAVKYITQNIEPDEVKYVADINTIYCKAKECGCEECQCDDIIYISKIIGFCDAFRNEHWAAVNMSYHTALDDFLKELESYKDAIAENIQAIIGQFRGNQFKHIDLPSCDNPLDLINQLKLTVHSWFECHKDDIEYEGCRNATSGLLETIHKYIYIFRLCKQSCD